MITQDEENFYRDVIFDKTKSKEFIKEHTPANNTDKNIINHVLDSYKKVMKTEEICRKLEKI